MGTGNKQIWALYLQTALCVNVKLFSSSVLRKVQYSKVQVPGFNDDELVMN